MQGTKLLEWLAMLSPGEQRQLRKFVHSPYFNEHEDLPRLLDILLAGHTGKAQIWQALCPGTPYNDLRLRHLCSLLLGLCERQLAVHRLLQQPLALQAECLQALRERAPGDLFAATARKFERQRDPAPPATSDAFLLRHRIAAEQNAWGEQQGLRSADTRLQTALDSLDDFYFFSKLKFACTILNNQRVVDVAFHNAIMPAILAELDQPGRQLPVALQLYRQVHAVLSEPLAPTHYAQLRALLDQHGPALPDPEARDLYALTMNHCIGRINAGEAPFLRELFGLYQVALARGFLLQDGSLSPWDYKNITVTGLRLQEFAWVEAFIEQYQQHISPEHRFNAYTYNRARLHFHRRQYGEALRLLQQIAYDDVFYNLDSKVMLLKIYYESSEVRALDALIDSFRIFLRRNRLISDQHRTNYLNLVRFVKQLSRLRPGDAQRLARIRAEVEATTHVADVGWLMEKLGEWA